MNIKISHKKIMISLLLYMASTTVHAVSGEFFSQTVYLHKFGNPVTQNKIVLTKSLQSFEIFSGLWFDHDKKTDASQVFTDAQVAPLAGVRTKVFGPSWLYSRFNVEGRWVYRTKSFTDDRARSTYEFRPGLLGYGLKEFQSPLFIENYYAVFYSHLYGSRMIAQGWARQGLRFFNHIDVLNEVFFDTFDLTRDSDGTADLRPGVRVFHQFEKGSVQLLGQYLYHFSNLEFSGRNEYRTTLVFGLYF